ncbi:hypothetical protein CH63R_07733 [Colletotrichum higginsianum IMI 349063]|uniref:Uncharacterized protein n=1 Tax=Colletotrichum higginsianum (strain IMI 349063) TaxID=759273 RepID=A0A1B7YAQ5_COLHI|nr:hypothetical protein CH63R_07733 [Colletotrichum higginsianum IMI 349063]OBR08968.1 hypothetical protein CH63R_07733 [Colletotrichum higginsianum IMI 349063]
MSYIVGEQLMAEWYPDNLSNPDTVKLAMPACEALEVRPKLEECAPQAPELDEPPAGNQWRKDDAGEPCSEVPGRRWLNQAPWKKQLATWRAGKDYT